VRDANFERVLDLKRLRAGRTTAGLAAIGLVAGVVAACVELQGSLGSDCLKNEDCQSGICSELHCVAAPPLLEAGFEADASGDATIDGGQGPETDGSVPPGDDGGEAGDASTALDVGTPDAVAIPADAPPDAMDEGIPDAPNDAPSDGPADAHLEAGEAG
jgi:hypothetical protein